MENTFKPNCKIVSHTDLGWTEDEYNDFMIDMFEGRKEFVKSYGKIIKLPIAGEPITITITSKDYYNPSK